MVKRYALVGGREDVEKFTFAHDDDGDFVPYSDYLILQTVAIKWLNAVKRNSDIPTAACRCAECNFARVLMRLTRPKKSVR